MSFVPAVEQWGSTPQERAAAYPCDALLARSAALFRAVDVRAPVAVVFRWLCQLRCAPYSYDWIDNLGKRSPPALTPGLERLAVGQRAMRVFSVVDFALDDHITVAVRSARAKRVLGDVVVSYRVVATDGGSRIVVKIAFRGSSNPVVRWLFAFGDLIMMRKQLLTLKALAERSAPVRS